MVKAKHTVVNFLKTLNYGTYLIDLFVLLFLVVFIQLEENIFNEVETIVPETLYTDLFKDSDIQLAGLMVALPSVLSIVVLVISIGKSNVLGTKIYKINSLRGPFCYSLLHFSILSVLMLAALTILSVFKLQMSLLYLDLAAASISVYFLVQEIPLLSNSELATRFIVRGIFRRVIKSIDDSNIDEGASQVLEKNETFLQISAYLVFDLGIYKAVNFVLRRGCPNNQWIATRILIKAEEVVLNSLIKGKRGTIFTESNSNGNFGYPVEKAFDGAAENLSTIIKTIGGFKGDNLITGEVKNLSDDEVKKTYGEDAKRLTKLLEKIELFYFNNDVAAKSKLQDAVLLFDGLLTNEKFFYLTYQLAVDGLENEDFWFIEKTILAQNSLLSIAFNSAYLLFVLSLLSFLKDRNLLTPGGSEKIDNFVSKRFLLLNGNSICFKDHFLYQVTISEEMAFVSALDQMIKSMGHLGTGLLNISMDKKYPSDSATNPFGLQEIIGTWLETILLIGPKNQYSKQFLIKIKSLADESDFYHLIIRNDLLEIMEGKFRGSKSKVYSLHRLLSLTPKTNLEKNFMNEKLVDDVWEFINFSDAKLQRDVANSSSSIPEQYDKLKMAILPHVLLPEDIGQLTDKKLDFCELQLNDGQREFDEIIASKIYKVVEDNAKNIICVESFVEAAGEYAKYFPCHGSHLNLLPPYRIDGGIPKDEMMATWGLKKYLPPITLFKDGAIQFCVVVASDEIIKKTGGFKMAKEPFDPKYGKGFKYAYQNNRFSTLSFSTREKLEELEVKSNSCRRITFLFLYHLDPENYVIVRKKEKEDKK